MIEEVNGKRVYVGLPKATLVLLEFAKKHHEVCEDCEGTGKLYNNADPTSGQWFPCHYAEAIAEVEGAK